jgi:hypothetical protein
MGLNLTLAPGIASVDPLPRTPDPAELSTPVDAVVETEASTSGDIYDALAMCESTMQNLPCAPYCGYFQFSEETWLTLGRSLPVQAYSYAEQKQAAIELIARSGWATQFPACAVKLGMA